MRDSTCPAVWPEDNSVYSVLNSEASRGACSATSCSPLAHGPRMACCRWTRQQPRPHLFHASLPSGVTLRFPNVKPAVMQVAICSHEPRMNIQLIPINATLRDHRCSHSCSRACGRVHGNLAPPGSPQIRPGLHHGVRIHRRAYAYVYTVVPRELAIEHGCVQSSGCAVVVTSSCLCRVWVACRLLCLVCS